MRFDSQGRAILHFDSVGEMADFANANFSKSARNAGGSWCGASSMADAMRQAKQGDESLVEEATKLLDKFDLASETVRRQYVPSVAGAFPIVPDYLSGMPECMRRMQEVSDTSNPIRIVVNMTSSAGVNDEQLLTRGVTILAFVMAVAQSRPIELSAFTGVSGALNPGGEDYCFPITRIETAPLDLATAAWAFVRNTFGRHFSYGFAQTISDGTGFPMHAGAKYKRSGYGGWPKLQSGDMFQGRWGLKDGELSAYDQRMREILELSETDVYVPEITSGDAFADPIKWIKDRLRAANLLVENV